MDRKTTILSWLALAATMFAPIAVILLVQVLAPWRPALPDIVGAGAPGEGAGEVLGNLSLSLSSIAVAVVVGAAVLVRSGGSVQQGRWRLAVLAMILGSCVTAVYCGYRFQVAVAEQIVSHQLELDRIIDRLEWQSFALLVCASGLLPLALHSFVAVDPASPPARRRRKPSGPRPGAAARARRRTK